ncbi:helix-turn-helix transcriptional regulator [Streptomyces sp. NBC_00620]|uniref:helix-turn-helix domain-containing protein n=1 Tax=unclassified Streptomyces TaxID=2593676 RepID=UPI00225180CF|nr:helix-turn-helix transcriptional regulator [Streptomyces sp. NBC_00620]MCX4973643.1 helix-turn-helix domain-containing protein [Streptomyces sp. NBC_00620]
METDIEYDDESSGRLRTVGRQIKLWREAAGLRQAELGAAIGYSEEQVSSVERGRRVPKPEFLDRADELLGAGGKISAMKKDVEEARYPKNLRDLTKLEADSVEMGAYNTHTIHALLQTEEHMRTLFGMRRPLYSEEVVEREVSARMARREIIDPARPHPVFSFVLEEATLRRPDGGRMVQHRQLEHLLEVGQLRNIAIQVMPMNIENHPGLGGSFRLFKLRNGATLGYTEAQHVTRLLSAPKEVQSLEMQYGNIRAEALRPGESLAFIEKLLGEK